MIQTLEPEQVELEPAQQPDEGQGKRGRDPLDRYNRYMLYKERQFFGNRNNWFRPVMVVSS